MVSEARRQLKGIVEEIASRTSITGDAEIMEIVNTWQELYGRFFRKYGVWFESKGRMDAIEQAGYMEQITEIANDMLDETPVFRYERIQSEFEKWKQTDVGQLCAMIKEEAEKYEITTQKAMAMLFECWQPTTKLTGEYAKMRHFAEEIRLAEKTGHLKELCEFTERFFRALPILKETLRKYLRGEEL